MKSGYWKIDEINTIIETRLFKFVDDDQNIVDSIQIDCFPYLKFESLRALLLSFQTNLSLIPQPDRKKFASKLLPKEVWSLMKNSFEKLQYTPTILYYFLITHKPNDHLKNEMMQSSSFITVKDFKKNNSFSIKQNIWIHSILILD